MALIERMQLMQYEKAYATDAAGNPVAVEHVKYAHVIERDGAVIQSIPHRIVIDRSNLTVSHPMPDGTVKTTADVLVDIGG